MHEQFKNPPKGWKNLCLWLLQCQFHGFSLYIIWFDSPSMNILKSLHVYMKDMFPTVKRQDKENSLLSHLQDRHHCQQFCHCHHCHGIPACHRCHHCYHCHAYISSLNPRSHDIWCKNLFHLTTDRGPWLTLNDKLNLPSHRLFLLWK